MSSINLFLFLAMTCAVTTYGLHPFRGTCKKMAIFKKAKKDWALSGHVISSHDVTSRLDCADQCLETSGCKSYNYQETGSPLHICELSSHTKTSTPSDYVIKSGFTYYDAEEFVLPVCASSPCQNGGTCGIDECTHSYECICKPGYIGENCETWFGLNGSSPDYPANSCLSIKLSGQDTGDGRYWIDPNNKGSPFTVFCDMTTDGGGWTVIKNLTLIDNSPNKTHHSLSAYRKITNLGKYKYLEQPLLLALKQDMGFTQIRYFCRKASVGRVFHIMTAKNESGFDVVRYFIENNSQLPDACNSFVRLPDDQSVLSVNCDKWGYESGVTMNNKWGRSNCKGAMRPYNQAAIWVGEHVFSFFHYRCDDTSDAVESGDTWKMFVR